MPRPFRFVAFTLIGVVILVAGCAAKPSKTDLVSTLQQVNGLTKPQAECVANGLFNGNPKASPPTRALNARELKAVAKPDNAGKVPADVTQILRDVVADCIPPTSQPGA